MSKPFSPRVIAGVLLSLSGLSAAPAQALSFVTFVSGKGTDSGTCASPATPCRSFQFAIDQTQPAGEVKVLDPANYRRVIITKSISITGVEGAGIDSNSIDAIIINAGPNDVVNLSHLTLDGLRTAASGITLNSGGSLTISQCTVRNFGGFGILLTPTGATRFLIGNTLVSGSPEAGVGVVPQGTGSAQGILDHVVMHQNFAGLFASARNTSGAVDVTAVDSVATNNLNAGFFAQLRGGLRLARSIATGNEIGILNDVGGVVESFGDNGIRGNTTDVRGALIPVATQ